MAMYPTPFSFNVTTLLIDNVCVTFNSIFPFVFFLRSQSYREKYHSFKLSSNFRKKTLNTQNHWNTISYTYNGEPSILSNCKLLTSCMYCINIHVTYINYTRLRFNVLSSGRTFHLSGCLLFSNLAFLYHERK